MSNSKSTQSFESGAINKKTALHSLARDWKVILAMCVMGLLGSYSLVLITPNQYEATAHINLPHLTIQNNLNPLGISLGDHFSLIERLKLPTTYSSEDIKKCGLENSLNSGESLAGLIKAYPLKGSSSIIVLKIRLESNEQSMACAQAIYERIRESQIQIYKPYLDYAKSLKLKLQIRLEEIQGIIIQSEKSGAAFSAFYLSSIEEIRFLREQIASINSMIALADMRYAKLESPILGSSTPVFPNKKLILMGGLLVGLFLGVLISFLNKILRDWGL